MAQTKQKSLKDWADELRAKMGGDIPEGMSDQELLREVYQIDPKVLEQISIEDRSRPDSANFGKDEGFFKALGGDIKGAAAANIAPITGSMGLGDKANRTSVGTNWGKLSTQDNRPEMTARGVGRGALNLDDIGNAMHRGDWGGAAGHMVLPVSMLASLGKGGMKAAGAVAGKVSGSAALDEMLNLGKSSLGEEGTMNAAKMLTRDSGTVLDKAIEGVDKAMSDRFVNVKSIRQAIAKPNKIISQIERSPQAAVKDVSAVKDVLERFSARTQKGMLGWKDLREFYKELGNAEGGLKGASQLRTALGEIKETVKTELQKGAEAAGQGQAFNKWLTDYSNLSKFQRSYVRIAKGATPAQIEKKLTAPTEKGIPKTPFKWGGKDAVQRVNRKQMGKWKAGYDQFHKSLTEPPKTGGATGAAQPPPTTPNSPAPAPQSPTPTGGAGTYVRSPRPNPVEQPNYPAPMTQPSGQGPQLPQAMQDILKKMNSQPF